MTKIFYADDEQQPEGTEYDCPYCGETGIHNDSGDVCSNPQCPTNN